ncbi:MAG: hypothetical protein HQL31_08800, partial [Planctomycetes bacterium]|nr:hypothetical protein [Planctomycetota bacterium]
DNLTVDGSFVLSAGSLDGNAERLNLMGDVTLSGGNLQTGTGAVLFGNLAGNVVSMSDGNLIIDSDAPDTDISIVAGTWTNSGGSIQFANASSATVFSALSPYHGLEINSTSGTYTATTDIDVNGPFTLTSGTVDMGANGKSLMI